MLRNLIHLRHLLARRASNSAADLAPSQFGVDWVLPKQLAVGRLPRPGDGQMLADAGITVVLTLCATAEGAVPDEVRQQFRCEQFILPDSNYVLPLDREQLAKAVAIVHRHIEDRQRVYVHCLTGVERSPTVCIAYLCLHQSLDLWAATNWLKQVHPLTMPTDKQLEAIRELAGG